MNKYPKMKTYWLFLINIIVLVFLYILLVNIPFHFQFSVIDCFDIKIFYLLICLCYFLMVYFSYYNEVFYSKQFENEIKYSDLTLEFLNLDKKYDTEEKIKNLFNTLTNNNINEISLVYDLSKYFKIKNEIENESDNLKKEKLLEKLNDLEKYFKENKEKYFLNRGYITFSNYKEAYDFKELFNKNKYGIFFTFFKNKIINEKKIKNFEENIKNKKFRIIRGIDPEAINFEFDPKRILKKWRLVFFVVVILIIFPIIAFILNILYFQNFINSNKDFMSESEYYLDYFYTFLLFILDQVAFFLIDYFLIPKKFYKSLLMDSYKFYFFNIYILLANIILPTYSMKLTYLNFIKTHDDIKIKKLMVDSLYMNYYLVVFDMINYKIIKPLLYILFKNISKNKKIINFAEFFNEDSIIFSFSYISSCLMYISFYCYLTPRVVTVMFFSLILLFLLDFYNRKSSRLEKFFPINILGNFWSYLIIILFPSAFIGRFLITPTFTYNNYLEIILKLVNNHEPVNFIDIDGFSLLFTNLLNILFKDNILLILSFLYIFLVILSLLLNKNERYLKRLQSRIWRSKKNIENLKITGKSYKEVNPVYQFI